MYLTSYAAHESQGVVHNMQVLSSTQSTCMVFPKHATVRLSALHVLKSVTSVPYLHGTHQEIQRASQPAQEGREGRGEVSAQQGQKGKGDTFTFLPYLIRLEGVDYRSPPS